MEQKQVQPQTKENDPPGWAILLFLVMFVAWGWFYLFVLRPQMNQWLAQYISGYPAMLHLVPIIGVPILVAMAVVGLWKFFNK